MEQLPPDLLAALPAGAIQRAEAWWASLASNERQRIAGLWDERLEVSFFTPQANDEGEADSWDEVPAVKGGRFVPTDDDGRQEWAPGYFEHLLQHPELMLIYEPPTRIFHIGCTQHAAARTCRSTGAVPGKFHCPAETPNCPLERLRGARLVGRPQRTLA